LLHTPRVDNFVSTVPLGGKAATFGSKFSLGLDAPTPT
jgi:hypothetical protein